MCQSHPPAFRGVFFLVAAILWPQHLGVSLIWCVDLLVVCQDGWGFGCRRCCSRRAWTGTRTVGWGGARAAAGRGWGWAPGWGGGGGRGARWEEEGRKEGVPRWRTDDGGGGDERQWLSARARVTERGRVSEREGRPRAWG